MLDTGYGDGFSIFEFKFNENTPHLNRYAQLFEQIRNGHVSATEFCENYIPILNIDYNWKLYNSDLFCDGSMAWFRKFVSVDNGGHDTINIEWSILKTLELNDFNIQAFVINHDDFLIGIILVYWVSSQLLTHLDDIEFKTCHLVGGGSFYLPINLREHNIASTDNVVSAQCLPKLDHLILNKCFDNVQYTPNILHSLGFVASEAQMKWKGDHKVQYAFFGLSGANGNYPCPVCLVNKQQLHSLPTPNTRSWKSRTYQQIFQSWIYTSAKMDFIGPKYNLQYIPLLVGGPVCLGLAILHILQGIGGRCWRIIQAILRFGKLLLQQQFQSDINVNTGNVHDSVDRNVNINQWKEALEERDELFREIKQCEEALEWLQCSDNMDFLIEVDSDTMQEKLTELTQRIKTYKQQSTELNNSIKQMETVLFDANAELRFLKLCERLNIKPWHYKDDSMIGPSVKKYLNNYPIVIEELKNFDPECARMMEPCLARLNFIAKCMWTKSEDFFNDECINYLKFNVIEFDWIYHKVIQKYHGGGGHRYGVKYHGLYHCVEWIEYLKWAPAFLDEQHLEAYNKFIHKYCVIYDCFGGHVNMHKMMNKIWRHFALN